MFASGLYLLNPADKITVSNRAPGLSGGSISIGDSDSNFSISAPREKLQELRDRLSAWLEAAPGCGHCGSSLRSIDATAAAARGAIS